MGLQVPTLPHQQKPMSHAAPAGLKAMFKSISNAQVSVAKFFLLQHCCMPYGHHACSAILFRSNTRGNHQPDNQRSFFADEEQHYLPKVKAKVLNLYSHLPLQLYILHAAKCAHSQWFYTLPIASDLSCISFQDATCLCAVDAVNSVLQASKNLLAY